MVTSTGDRVVGSLPHISFDSAGSCAEYLVINEDFIARVPASISSVEAASLPVIGLTVLQALHEFVENVKGPTL